MDHHTRNPYNDSRGIGGVHYHEKQIRAEKGLEYHQFSKTISEKLDITSETLRRSGASEAKIVASRSKTEKFYNKLIKC